MFFETIYSERGRFENAGGDEIEFAQSSINKCAKKYLGFRQPVVIFIEMVIAALY